MGIGETLKEAREAKNLSLDDIQRATKIQTRYLQAIEKGNYSIMPGNFYVRAFIKEYAAAVDLDPDALMEEHRSELPAASDESSVQYTRVQRSRKDTTTSTKSPAIFSFLPTVIVVLLVIGIIFTVWYLYQESQEGSPDSANQGNNDNDEVYVGDPDASETKDEESNNTSNDNEEEEGSQEDENTEKEEQPEPESELKLVDQGTQGDDQVTTFELVHPGDEVIVEVTSENDHWLQIREGENNELYSAMFGESDSPLKEDLTGADQFMIRYGNPSGGIEISVAGVPLEVPDMASTKVQKVFIEVADESAQQQD
ncbi:helix-turn-helix domain-containing protein [Sediminibacillus albus]|uniref:Protein RodZ, contains Xre-like HTH and DUF4115 domains n=1 Tax=Sediminibacillus albus TaxID=407036 RepID=A0A1G8VYP6_9BACI|nr:helix-turn-helix domain-containing protein [Sediminibacillus albus]SDJ71119.1 protein RodZ, contains Xre-like HTH and DUF4115 domains [Sediminibacillus albus]